MKNWMSSRDMAPTGLGSQAWDSLVSLLQVVVAGAIVAPLGILETMILSMPLPLTKVTEQPVPIASWCVGVMLAIVLCGF